MTHCNGRYRFIGLVDSSPQFQVGDEGTFDVTVRSIDEAVSFVPVESVVILALPKLDVRAFAPTTKRDDLVSGDRATFSTWAAHKEDSWVSAYGFSLELGFVSVARLCHLHLQQSSIFFARLLDLLLLHFYVIFFDFLLFCVFL